MARTFSTVLFMLLFACGLPAVSLSVLPLAEALKNPALADETSPEFAGALAEVTALMLNQPPEQEADPRQHAEYRRRTSSLARHRETRVGRLFFAALEATPAIENLPSGSEKAAISANWPLALGASVSVHAEFILKGDDWLIARLDVTADGVAAATLAGMAPYFSTGRDRVELLNVEVLDYLVGRDPADRELPDLERPSFDFDAAIARIFALEAGAFRDVTAELVKKVSPSELPAARMKLLEAHLASREEIDAMKAADNDDAKSREFWDTMYAQLKQMHESARPAGVPSVAGARVTVKVTRTGPQGRLVATTTAIRLASGKIAPRGAEERQ